MKKNLWIFGALAALGLAAVAVVAQTPSPSAAGDEDASPAMEMFAMRRMAAGGAACPSGIGAGMSGPGMGMRGCGQSMMCGGGGCGMGGGRAGRGMGLMRLQALDLTSDQWSRVRRIQDDFQKQIIPKQGEIRVAQIDLQQLLQATQPNMNQVNSKITAIGNLRTQIQTLRAQEMVQIRGVLNAEQLTKFLDPNWTAPCPMPGMQGGTPGAGRRPMMSR